ncbi:hypothetical protein KXQ82_11920 [Mucilaginibacter sp. HMF5004]|uniref:hypothetical protein n=1 Tax=Mucilaginibacter rivuli TaxID=2857527 RepID=UPI001C5FD8CB|nr:hypothetical protein [Mucilaginibacter rivuli]MBW4890432.1 hypothetical protein [Mucilaginibacter rivuli]
MKYIKFLVCLILLSGKLYAQELYVNTEPASNMATKAIGIRLNTELQPLADNRAGLRLNPEVMFGFSKNLMVHANLYASSLYQPALNFEGASIYAKYRFLALDQPRAHFRIAGTGRVSLINNPVSYNSINLQGDNSGYSGGLVVTQLLHKLALSATANAVHSLNNISNPVPAAISRNQLDYSFSAGYLLLPKTYTDYKQTNVNLYVEFLGKSSLDNKGSLIDIAPAVQFIFNSTTRLDLSYQTQLSGNLSRTSNTTYLIRLEHNLFNAF